MDKTAGIVTALVIAPMAIVITVALLRGYKFDIHFERTDDGGRGLFSRKKPKDPTDNNDEGDA